MNFIFYQGKDMCFCLVPENKCVQIGRDTSHTHMHDKDRDRDREQKNAVFFFFLTRGYNLAFSPIKKKESGKDMISICGGHFNLLKGRSLWL